MNDLSPQIVMERLDALSRTRALTDAESLSLEKAIRCLSAEPHIRCTKRDAARAGLKRDMGAYKPKSRSDHAITMKIEAAQCAAAVLVGDGHHFEAEQINALCRAARALHTTAAMQRKDLDELRARAAIEIEAQRATTPQSGVVRSTKARAKGIAQSPLS